MAGLEASRGPPRLAPRASDRSRRLPRRASGRKLAGAWSACGPGPRPVWKARRRVRVSAAPPRVSEHTASAAAIKGCEPLAPRAQRLLTAAARPAPASEVAQLRRLVCAATARTPPCAAAPPPLPRPGRRLLQRAAPPMHCCRAVQTGSWRGAGPPTTAGCRCGACRRERHLGDGDGRGGDRGWAGGLPSGRCLFTHLSFVSCLHSAKVQKGRGPGFRFVLCAFYFVPCDAL